jgi:hypothetical protein
MRTQKAILQDCRALRKKFRDHQKKQCCGCCRNECKLILRNPFKVYGSNFCHHAKRWSDQYFALFVEIMEREHKKDPSALADTTSNLLIPTVE